MEKFENIKVGDKVIVRDNCGYGDSIDKIATVTKVNKCSFNCETKAGSKYTFKLNGIEKSDNVWHKSHCFEYTEDEANRIKEENLRRCLISNFEKFDFKQLSTDTLKKINQLIVSN